MVSLLTNLVSCKQLLMLLVPVYMYSECVFNSKHHHWSTLA